MGEKRRIIAYISVSIDGYIAKNDGTVIMSSESMRLANENCQREHFSTCDTVLMSQNAYDVLANLTTWPYKNHKVYVFSQDSSTQIDMRVTFVREQIKSFLPKLKGQQGKNIWLSCGTKLLKGFMVRNLIDDYIINTLPVIQGDGLQLLKAIHSRMTMSAKKTKIIGDIIQTHYQVNKMMELTIPIF